jgi:SAM-dependent MidA family methyltransferase
MPYQTATLNALTETIRAEIAKQGAISFARFMELALYCPQLGYYEQKKDTVGRQGDFYTSVSVGALFGEILAFQFAEWLETEVRSQPPTLEGFGEPRRSEVRIVEAGAHDGKLAADILRWLRVQRPELFARLAYIIIEPSARRRAWQEETLREFAANVRWHDKLPALDSFTIIFSNELLDAFPVHRLGWNAAAKKWFEWSVQTDGDNFSWTRLAGEAPSAIHYPPSSLAEILPADYTIEICPSAEAWWAHAAKSLIAGKLVTIDYGLTTDEFFAPARVNGTLRAYHRHQASADLLANIGEQDLTAHVNFSALQSAGETVGLKTEGLFTQAQFLTTIAGRIWKNPATFGAWTPGHTRQFQTLTHPEHLGRAFRVLVQSR